MLQQLMSQLFFRKDCRLLLGISKWKLKKKKSCLKPNMSYFFSTKRTWENDLKVFCRISDTFFSCIWSNDAANFWYLKDLIPAFKLKSLCLFPLVCTLNAWKTFAGKETEKKKKETEGKNPVSCIVATFRPLAGKEGGQETKKHTWKNAALVREERRSRMQLPWYFIHQLIYG